MHSRMEPSSSNSTSPFCLPERLPMLLLDDCYHFPGCHLPLFIFEERYRMMLDYALRSDRMFCVGVGDSRNAVLPVVTAGLVSASLKNPDGTSQVMLYGVDRMRITGWEQAEPFRIAKVERFEAKYAPPENLKALKARALELLPIPTSDSCEGIQKLRHGMEQMDELEMVCDVLSFHFVRRKEALRFILQEACPQRRYEQLVAELENAKA